jgi:hypothetical protein
MWCSQRGPRYDPYALHTAKERVKWLTRASASTRLCSRSPTHAHTRTHTHTHIYTEENNWFLVPFHGYSNSQTRVNITVFVHCLSCHTSRCSAVSVLMDHLLIHSHLWQRLFSRTVPKFWPVRWPALTPLNYFLLRQDQRQCWTAKIAGKRSSAKS